MTIEEYYGETIYKQCSAGVRKGTQGDCSVHPAECNFVDEMLKEKTL